MATLSKDITGLVDTVVRPLLEFEDELSIDATEDEDGTIYLELHVNEADAGKVIGRQGRIIKSIRTLARACAAREGVRVEVELAE